MTTDIRLSKQQWVEDERVLHFCGVSFPDEVSSDERAAIAASLRREITASKEATEAFDSYHPESISSPYSFSTRIAGVAVAIANYVAGNPLFDRRFLAMLPKLTCSRFFRWDPAFGEEVDHLIGRPEGLGPVCPSPLRAKQTLRVADVGCAPKRNGSGTLLLLKDVLTSLFPDKRFEFFGYDIDYRQEYALFGDNSGLSWEQGYLTDSTGVAEVGGAVYYDARNPRFNIRPQYDNGIFIDTFDRNYNRCDIIVNTMFYSVLEMNNEPPESLRVMLENLLAMRTAEGALFLNTCDDCVRVFPSPGDRALDAVIPFVPSSESIGSKIDDILTGGVYCTGMHDSTDPPGPEEREEIRKHLYRAHRLATRELTFLDRLYEVYERVNEARRHDALAPLSDPAMQLDPERKASTRKRIYALKCSLAGSGKPPAAQPAETTRQRCVRCTVCDSANHRLLFDLPPRWIVLCSECRHEFVNPLPLLAAQREYRYPETERSVGTLIDLDYIRKIVEKYGLVNCRLIDLGCGEGRLIKGLMEAGFDARNLYLMDRSRAALEHARRKYGSATIIHGDAQEGVDYREHFECALMVEFLEDLEYPEKAVRNALNALEVGGLLIIRGIPNNESLEAFIAQGRWKMRQYDVHYHFFNAATFSRFVARFNGIEVLEYGTFLQPGYRFYHACRIARNIGVIRNSVRDGKYQTYNDENVDHALAAKLVLERLAFVDFGSYIHRERLPLEVLTTAPSVRNLEDFFNIVGLIPRVSPDFSAVIRKTGKG
ncbi:MAG TPA: class I SAM-dependent methyltransferase [Planctomycetota bacterium]|nr:class I SAM-dependent methyltransferase [Planctomycetota bacterium]